MFSDKKTMHGMTCAKVFVTIEGFIKVFPTRNKVDAYDSLNNFCVTVGLPLNIVTGNAKEKYGGKWMLYMYLNGTSSSISLSIQSRLEIMSRQSKRPEDTINEGSRLMGDLIQDLRGR
jgi:hypothetical protein